MDQRYTSTRTAFTQILQWQIKKLFAPKTQSPSPLRVQTQSALPEGEYALWLGHASVWCRLGNSTVAIDPVLGDIPMYRRHTPLPLPKEALQADILLLTHAHYDHYDRRSVEFLLRQNPQMIIVAPEGFWRYLKGRIPRERCFELHWWESVMIGGLFITLVPAKHWSKRTLWDTNKALWGGYVIQHGEHTLYHSGDSAYGDHFKEIAERFEITEAFLPIGAYRPESIMKPNHLNPPEAIQAAIDCGTKTLIPIHYGSFKLSDEPLDEPLQWYQTLTQSADHPFVSKVLEIGEIYRFNTTSTLKST